MDAEDYLGIRIGKKEEIKSYLDNLEVNKLGEIEQMFINLEKFWFDLNQSSQSSIDENFGIFTDKLQNIEVSSTPKILQRRILVLRNRLELLRILSNGEEGKEKAEEVLMSLNLNQEVNLISQHNLVVLAFINNKESIAKGLLSRISNTDDLIYDEVFSKVYLSLMPGDKRFMNRIAQYFDDKAWFTYVRGLASYQDGKFAQAYDYLSVTLKKIKYEISRRTNFAQRPNALINLVKLNSGRYSSKAIFCDKFIVENCPVLFMNRLTELEANRHIFNLQFLIGVLNKFLLKPQIAISSLLDLIETILEKSSLSKDTEVFHFN